MEWCGWGKVRKEHRDLLVTVGINNSFCGGVHRSGVIGRGRWVSRAASFFKTGAMIAHLNAKMREPVEEENWVQRERGVRTARVTGGEGRAWATEPGCAGSCWGPPEALSCKDMSEL